MVQMLTWLLFHVANNQSVLRFNTEELDVKDTHHVFLVMNRSCLDIEIPRLCKINKRFGFPSEKDPLD